ncbi:MAG: DUF1326 domain-containing protein [Dehalococcoidales bacterium]|nr:DUF1326 domain-containing protein [Dehalococcoidales bacterium]
MQETEWALSGYCTEACTSPPVCPYYWGSSTPRDLHDGYNQCEGAFTFHINHGCYGDIGLDELNAGIGFNTPVGGTTVREPWKSVFYIDSRANAEQAAALEKIFRACWARMGEVLDVKRAPISFAREAVGNGPEYGYRHLIIWGDVYSLKAEPLMSMNGLPRFISSMTNGIIYVGKSTENRFSDPDLPRGKWDRPEMSNTYYNFSLNPDKLQWMP